MEHCYIETTEQGYSLEICSNPIQDFQTFTALILPLTLTGLILLPIYAYRKERIDKVLAKCERVLNNAD